MARPWAKRRACAGAIVFALPKATESDLLFYIGLGLEGFIDSAKNTLSEENVELVATADAISDEELESGQSHGEESLENHEHEHHDEENHDNHAEEESHDD
ncbi:Zinc-binding protein adcA, partial [Planococcus antarcticus DSM 14505]